MTETRAPHDTGRVILHVDMDAFFASVELRDRPDLRGRPMMVGGAVRGVVVSATYEARAHGVRSGQPMSQARRLSPTAVVLPPRHEVYRAVSKAVFTVFDDVSHLVEAASVDEAFLDITASIRRVGSPATIGQQLRARIAREHDITCTVGIAPTKLVAKMASTSAKPDGLRVVPPSQVLAFLHPLPIEKLWGVGEATATRLHRFGLRTVGELAQTPLDTLIHSFGPHQGRHLSDLARGLDPRTVDAESRERSVGSSETFETDTDDRTVISTELLRMADRTASRLRMAGLMARTVAVTIRYCDFTTITRSLTLPTPTDSSADLHRAALTLFDRLGPLPRAVRLVGVRGEGLVETASAEIQPTLDEPDTGWREAEAAVDEAIAKFGAGAVHRAALGRRRSH